jgi:hypothetical protein
MFGVQYYNIRALRNIRHAAILQEEDQVRNVSGLITFNPLNAELKPICHVLALLGAHPILHVSRIRVKNCASYV